MSKLDRDEVNRVVEIAERYEALKGSKDPILRMELLMSVVEDPLLLKALEESLELVKKNIHLC